MECKTLAIKGPVGLVSSRSDRPALDIWRHLLVVGLAAVATGVIFSAIFDLEEWIRHLVLPPLDARVPPWVSSTFFVYLCFYLVGIVFPFFLFIGWREFARQDLPQGGAAPFVSIIIPAYNEQNAIADSVKCALDQNYPNYEVIVVDDGSSDFTPYSVENQAVSFIRLRRNRGKAAALNAGIGRAKGEIIVFSDSDSCLDPDAVRRLVEHFNDPSIGAVAGKIKVASHRSFLERWQTLEYLLAQMLVKPAQVGSGASVMVCPGPVCAYRRHILLELEGYKDRTLVEDFDLTLETIGHAYRVAYEPRAIAWTNVPQRWGELLHQRIRWNRGNLQVFSGFRHCFLQADYGILGMFWLPYSLLVGFGNILIEIVILLSFPFLLYFSGAPSQTLLQGLVFMAIIELLGTSQYLFALGLERRAFRPDLILAAFLAKPFHLFIAWTRLVAIFREIRHHEATWNG